MKKLLIACIGLFLSLIVQAQSPAAWTSADMYLALRKLNVLGSVLYIAAHPDDENTRLLTYFSKDKLYRTGYLSLTRGDGGQNLIGDEQGIELGLIRTQELLAARRIDGAEQFFSRAYDFGYSKNPEETMKKWDKEKILSDLVWVIRKFQPDIIITRFPVTGEGGHGHHTASAILANEAFTAAADPAKFSEQLKYTIPWQAKRILFNSFTFGNTNTVNPSQFKVDVGGYNPLLGKSYGEIAAESRSQHKSQGFGVPASRGESIESFSITGGTAPVNDLMDGTELSWKRVSGGEEIAKKIDQLISSFDLLHPEKSVAGLVALYKNMNQLPDGYWKTQKQKEVQELIAQCSGLFLDVTSYQPYAVQTDSIRINFSFNNRLGTDAVLQRVKLDQFDSVYLYKLPANKNIDFAKIIAVPLSKPVTQPYWLQEKMAEGNFTVTDPQLIGQPDITPAYTAAIELSLYGERFTFHRAVKYKYTDPVRGELYQPVVVMPSYTVKINPDMIVSNSNKALYEQQILSYKANNTIAIAEKPMTGKTAAPVANLLMGKNQQSAKQVVKQYPASTTATRSVETYWDEKAKHSLVGERVISYEHIPQITYFKESSVTVNLFPFLTEQKKIGYITGAGDKVPLALEQMGYELTLLTDKELSRYNLQQFDAIITGVRAYNTNEWMNTYYEKLMKYVNDGGNLIVQYNTSNNIGPVKAKIGPYDFAISRTRVTDENASVHFLKPAHPVLNFPNKITPADFNGWIQERSIYHAANWDKNFETILSMNDPGEKADEGSLVIAKYGKGYFTYTGLVFFRELPAGVPGAYRLLANIIALNKKKAF